ncbi:MAG: 5-(carboxyamino)imidazole ribonucleotide synthase [Thermomicrobiales bacterium]
MRVGIVGGGQLGMMLAEAAVPLGIAVTVLDKEGCPASFAGATVIEGAITDGEKTCELASQVDVVTVEIEHVNTSVLAALAREGVPIHPSPQTLITIKDKLAQKMFLREHGIATAEFLAIAAEDDIREAAARFGYPFLLKARHGGYDGRGNVVIHGGDDIPDGIRKLGGAALYAERFVPFGKELAVMVARGADGAIVPFPVVETKHEESILRWVMAPAPIDALAKERAEQLASSAVSRLSGAGMFGVEMFLTGSGDILINEIAPRVHNSGHYTIEACQTSQFAQHLLAVTGESLGSTAMVLPAAAMVNILGERSGTAAPSGGEEAAARYDASVHWYHKRDVVPLRKMGHLTVTGDDAGECLERALAARRMIDV